MIAYAIAQGTLRHNECVNIFRKKNECVNMRQNAPSYIRELIDVEAARSADPSSVCNRTVPF
jgi:hypothetical protein